ncbi:vanin-like protein 2 isoform X1 [Maniola hyperantus]|uniref:vanin-like protein 2 isoform X1 n=1 Tax=Aphantopus hyperantus TaxID=2795564 RepID=UPI00156A415B|nr:vanin-like protein 2 isoform X1 [Maniola hyperantus]
MAYHSLCILLCLFGFSSQKSTFDDTSYVAAVVEYEVQANSSLNLQNYVQLIRDAAKENADIVVFPEMTLTVRDHVVVPIKGLLKEHPVPALRPDLYDEVLVSISSAAKENQIYVVVNVEEKVDCTGGAGGDVAGESCPEQKVYLYNTNVVFDRGGAVIDRYRKINLFGESTRTPGSLPDLGIFETDFGVTFGHFICFDLMFQVPAIQIVQKYNITDIVFSTMWFSELPYLTAVQIQEAYAYSMNVNFLGAGANNVRVGSAGSGIYSGKAGALVSIMPGVPTTKLLVARVPKVPGQLNETAPAVPGPIYNNPVEQDSLYLLTDPSLVSHTTRLLTPGNQQFILADKDVSCYFRVRLSERSGNNTYRYRAGAFSGVRTYNGFTTGGLRICSVFACTNDTLESCGQRFPQYSLNSTAVFETLIINAGVPIPETDEALSAKKTVYFPITLDTSLKPLRPDFYNFEERQIFNALTVYAFDLRNSVAELYSFAVWGREYTTDGEEPTDNNETTTPAPEDPDTDSSGVHRLHLLVLFFCTLSLLRL